MKTWMKPNKIEWISYISLMPVLALALNLLLFGPRVWMDKQIWLISYPLICLQGLISWYLHVMVMHWLRIQFPHIKQTTVRLVLLALAHVSLTFITFAIIFLSYDALNFLGYELDMEKLQQSIVVAIGLTMVSTTLWESDYTYTQWKNSVAEKEKLQQLTILHEFEALKSQVNPHFLFNCFNTLSSLISEDKKKAETFLDELSKVYRYLLRNNTDGLSTLEEELRFIRSYYRLLQTRYGEGLQLNIETDKRYDQYILPSLSLQLLVENAVKHNIVLQRSPLVVDIFTTAGNILVVNNNLQLRHTKPASSRIGLQNIRYKYELLNRPGFQVLQDSKNFSVVLPLIWSPTLANSILSIKEKNELTH
jgi:two-component system, LytTR family, sensor kinase